MENKSNIMNMKKVMSLIGLAMRSGNLVSGDDTTLKEVKKKNVKLVIIADDASDNTKKLFKDKCSYRNIAFLEFGTKSELGSAIGKSPRAVLGIKNEGFAEKLTSLIENI